MSGDVPVGAFVMFGLIIAIILLINLETLKVARETRTELYTAVRHFAEEMQSLRTAHDEHIAGTEAHKPEKRTVRRLSTDYADWVTDSNITKAT